MNNERKANRLRRRAEKKESRYETLAGKSIAQGKKGDKKYAKSQERGKSDYQGSYKKSIKTKARSLKKLDKAGQLEDKADLYDMGANRKQVKNAMNRKAETGYFSKGGSTKSGKYYRNLTKGSRRTL